MPPSDRGLTVEQRSSYRARSSGRGPLRGSGDASADLAAVLVAVGSGDPDAFQVLYEQCARRVYGVVRKTLQNPDSCAEVTQEVFLMVWEQGDRYRPELGHPVSWLMTLAHRRAVDRLRMETTRTARDEKWGRRNWDTGFDEVAETVLERENTADVQAAMTVLSPLQHQAISLAYFSHLTYNEVANHLGIPAPTAKTRIRDGLKKLRRVLEEQRQNEPR
ncbi:sigma-70 family RNA polymerase sigma factor [Arthrobacter sp. Soc17.1.1.1]|uniref:sigma-70 family RNA polymerase sigma factor n=1 Tax=Arthrobacter sp. Soc17.1.1.1 TaxID=3121277 RepID=UPI002FE4EB4F